MTTPAIAVDGVWKSFRLYHERNQYLKAALLRGRRARYEEFWALKGVSFEVPHGATFGIIGSNGSGKSTLLKCLAGILFPERGRVSSDGRLAALLELGAGFHPELTGVENIYLNGAILGMTRKEITKRFDDIVSFAGLEQFIDTPVKNYSSGMTVRLGFAIAANVEPEILLIDEVLSVGDESFQRKCMERIYGFRRAGKTIIFVSHALDVVRSLCDVAVWLDHGRQMASGPAGKVIDAYLADVNRQEQERIAAERPDDTPPEEPDNPFRRGTREVEIVRVQLLASSGEERAVFSTGESLTIRMHYHAHERVARPIFGVGIHHESGTWLIGPNTGFDEVHIAGVDGSGIIEYHLPSLSFNTGRYQVSVAVVDATQTHTFDLHDRIYPLVIHTPGRERHGIVALPGEWRVTP
jgi:ABC-type polysaccharide/polyol phosphate transport system ATPase subunit